MQRQRSIRRIFTNIIWATGLVVAIAALTRLAFAQSETSANLVSDPYFEDNAAGFYAQDYGSVYRSTDAPIEGAASLRLETDGWGTAHWWSFGFAGKASSLSVAAHLRSDLESGSNLQFCAIVYYADWSTTENCTAVSGSAGDKGVIAAQVDVDPTQTLMWVNIRMFQEGSDPLRFTLDAADARLVITEQPPAGGGDQGGGDSGGGDNGGGDSGGGSNSNACTPSPDTVYPGFTYQLPTVRPFVPLTDYTQGGAASPSMVRLKGAADAAIQGNPPYGYAPKLSLIAYRATGNQVYLTDAITRVEAFVTEFENAIANGEYPDVAGDSYLEVGWYIENLALTYDQAYEQLTPSQRQRWAAIADQTIYNVWHPSEAEWGGQPFPWTGWSVCDPGNNYHFSFLRATMTWALVSQNAETIAFLQAQKFPPLLDYYAALPGGGTREGTGYGSAIGNMLGNFITWKTATGEDLANIIPHTRETIDYWVHATVPTRDRFAPIADLSRESIPNLYDYQENLIHQAVVLSPGTAQARRGTWWLQNNSVNGVAHVFNIAGDLLPYPDQPEAPTALMYHSPGAGALFARTNWDTDATWMAVVAGKYDQSHAHHDQGSFTFFKNDWLSVTSNIWSHSGLHLEDDAHNVIRFERADASVIAQNPSDAVESSMTATTNGSTTTVVAELANAYSAHANLIQGWTRTLVLSEDTLRVTDTCTVAQGVQPIFQLQVPAVPVLKADGSIEAGDLRIVPMQPVTMAFVSNNAAEFSRGYRVELRSTGGCGFDVELQAFDNPAPQPGPGPNPNPNPTPSPTPSPNASPAPVPTTIVNDTDPIQAIWSESGPAAVRVKSPAQHMRFTAGAPIRILADARDPNAWMCPPGHPPYVCPGTLVRFYVDGQLVGSATPSATDMNLWEMRLGDGLPAGDHVLAVAYVPYAPGTSGGGQAVNGLAPVTIHVDPPAARATEFELTEDLVLSGSTDLNWNDVTVIGNGFKVVAADGFSGNVTIQNASIGGLGGYTTPGIDVVTTGAVTIADSVFEATGGVRIGAIGADPITIARNELRANNLLTYVSSNPDVPVMLELIGGTTAAKTIVGNRIGAGILRVRGNGWQIGGLDAASGNVLIGPRVVLELNDSSNNVIQGNYLRHDYHGGFSQGFNIVLWGSSDNELIEHNVIRGGSWPVQNGGGEFRYNLIADSGHNFWRGAKSNTSIHHNVFAHTSGGNTGFEGVFKFFGGETGVTVFNNTFDVAGSISGYDGPAFNIGEGTSVASIRNNAFTGFRNVSGFGGALVSAPGGVIAAPRVGYADYNAWFNPLAPATTPYLPEIVNGVPGLHDVTANPQFAGTVDLPYRIAEGCIWLGNCSTSEVLARYREIYRLSPGSPLVGAGNPADGQGTMIGAVGADTTNPADRFGRQQ
jgi:hypothetical protein